MRRSGIKGGRGEQIRLTDCNACWTELFASAEVARREVVVRERDGGFMVVWVRRYLKCPNCDYVTVYSRDRVIRSFPLLEDVDPEAAWA
jgi:hypothetical protein